MRLLRRQLKNGMNVIMEKRELPVVSLSITNRFGASFEDSKIKGIAHFMEHLVFTGTKTRSHEDISREIEKRGGILNAFTSHDVTSFWFKLPSEHVFIGLEILSDLLLNPIFESEKFEKEKKVILEEIKMYHDTPQRHVFDKIEACLYEKPFGESVIGSAETIKSLSRDFVAEYFKKNYFPEDYIVTIVGDADFDKICSFLEEKFSRAELKLSSVSIKTKHGKFVEQRDGIDQAHFVFGVHAPLMNEKNYAVLEILDAYLANGMSSKLFLEIREKRGLAYSVKGSISTEKRYSYYTIYVGTTKEAVKEVERLIIEEFNKVKDISDKEIREAQEQVIGLKRVTSEESSNVMNELMFYELGGKAEDYYNHEARIRSVTKKEVVELASSLVKKYSTAIIMPK